jgi:phosphocarrier protein FPr
MVTSLSEIVEARTSLEAAAKHAGLSQAPPLGVMVEVPSAALLAERLAPATDFFSIGTNDLAQYALAVDRSNPDVAPLYQPLHPAILRMLKSVIDAGRRQGRPVAVCGELAGEPVGIAVLVGLGIREVSVTPVAIAGVKDLLGAVDSTRVRALAEKALAAAEASEVEKLFRSRP